VVAGVEHLFELTPALKATDSALVFISSSQDGTLRVPLDKTTQLDEPRDTVRYSLAATNVPNLKSGSPVDVDLQIKHADGSAHVLRVVSKGTYYEKEADTQASVKLSRGKQDQPIKVDLTLPVGSVAGFGSIAKGSARVGVSLSATALGDAPFVVEVDCPIPPPKPAQGSKATTPPKPDVCQANLPIEDSKKRTLRDIKNADLKATVTLVGPDVPKLASADVTITP
jgi:hypothetical protein